jgi:transglutaminase-like putative cysteine protease
MSGNRLRWCGLLGGLGLAWLAACARGPVPEYPPIAHADRIPSTEQAPVRLMSSRFEYVFDDAGNWQETFTQRYRILNQQGVETWGGTAAGWSPWYMARPELEAQVQDPGGAVRKLDPSAVAEAPAYPELPDIYGDRRILRAPLPGVHIGSEVTETMRRRTTRPFFPGGTAFQVTFQSGIPREQMELVVDLPASLPFTYELLEARVKKEEKLAGGRRRVAFRAEKLDAVEGLEAYSPGSAPSWPSVAFSTGGSWQKIASAYEDVMNDKLKGDAGVAELARRSVTAGASDIGKANQLLFALHERVRYVAVEFGQSAIVPTSPAEVLRRTYGDCKDQALVLVAMLRAVGLPATLALLRVGPGEDVRPRLPALGVFNHAIVVVQSKDPFWIDPTSSYARAGELPETDQGRLALIVSSESQGLTLTPSLEAKQNGYLEVREIRLREQGPARVSEVSSGTGVVEQRLRDSFAASQEQRVSDLTDYVKKQYAADKLIGAKFDGLDDVRRPLRLSLDAEGTSIAPVELFRATVPVDYNLITSWLPEPVWDDKPRRAALELPLRYQAEVRYRIVPPPHYRAERLPPTPEVALGPARLSRRYDKLADGSISASFRFEIDQQRLSPASLAALRQGLQQLSEEAKDELVLVHDAEALFERAPKRALQLLQEQIASEPRRAWPLLRLASKLGELGFGASARERARQAVALEPRNALAARTLAKLLEKDELGRIKGRDTDDDGAARAYRRAIELDDSDSASKLWLAALLERGKDGVRLGAGARLDEALQLYDAVPSEELADLESGVFMFSAGNLLLDSQRFDELSARVAGLPAAFGVAVETDKNGVAAGVAYATERGLTGSYRVTALSAAARSFYTARRYAEAAGLYEEAVRSDREGASYAGLARVLKSASRLDPAKLPEDSPEALVRKVELQVTAAEDAGQLPTSLLSPRAPSDLLSGWWKPLRFESLTATSPSRAVRADVRGARLQMRVDGSDSVGYRVRVRELDLEGDSRSFGRYVVKTAGKYRLRADSAAEVGCEALDRARQGDAAGAKQWLLWARDTAESEPGDDPLRGAPFVRLWADGRGNAELAAAALCATGARGAAAREVLSKTPPPAIDEAALLQARALAALAANDSKGQLAAAERLVALQPGSARARELQLQALWRLERFADVEREARKAWDEPRLRSRRARIGDTLGHALAQNGKLLEAQRIYEILLGEAAAADLSKAHNQAAWLGLFMQPRPKTMRQNAELAVELSRGNNYAELHTLACVLLDLGQLPEARRAAQRLFELEDDVHVDGTHYLRGALAEAYGLTDLARAFYERVPRHSDGIAQSSYALARARLKALGPTTR